MALPKDTGYMGDLELPLAITQRKIKLKNADMEAFERRTKRWKVGSKTLNFADDLLRAYQNVGGVFYLTQFAAANPEAFLKLMGKLLPLKIVGDITHSHKVDLSGLSVDELRSLEAIFERVRAAGADTPSPGREVVP